MRRQARFSRLGLDSKMFEFGNSGSDSELESLRLGLGLVCFEAV